MDLFKVLYRIYEERKEEIIKIFPLRNWNEIYYNKSPETYTSVNEIISYYEKNKIFTSCFVDSYKSLWYKNKNNFDDSLSIVNNNLKLDDHILKNQGRFIISDWKRSCVSSVVIDYGLLKRRLLDIRSFKNYINLLDEDILKINRSLLSLSNLVVLHRVFSEIYSRIIKSKKTFAFHKNPLKIGGNYFLCINNLKALGHNYFSICHRKCYEISLNNLQKLILEKICSLNKNQN